jgi:hypothetical protein
VIEMLQQSYFSQYSKAVHLVKECPWNLLDGDAPTEIAICGGGYNGSIRTGAYHFDRLPLGINSENVATKAEGVYFRFSFRARANYWRAFHGA